MADLGLGEIDWDAVDEHYTGEETPNVISLQSETVQQIAPEPFEPVWPEPASHLVKTERPAPPKLPLDDILPSGIASWIRCAAASKGAPNDYVFAALMVTTASLIGPTRLASPWNGWLEPAILWSMLIGNPSAGKSPALDGPLAVLRELERDIQEAATKEFKLWQDTEELAKLVEASWKEMVKKAIKNGEIPPDKPEEMNIGPAPHIPLLSINDVTVERLAVILSKQPKGILQVRDELAGWLENMERYSGGSDRTIWLEALGGRRVAVEGQSREAVVVERFAVSVVGGIQPDRLRTLLLNADDDGLVARFLPVWPDLAPIAIPKVHADQSFMRRIFVRLYDLQMHEDQKGNVYPAIVHFTDGAAQRLNAFRETMRELEHDLEGLMLSFIGKCSGLTVRLSLVLAALEYACGERDALDLIDEATYAKAERLVREYFIPMAERTYVEASVPADIAKARTIVRAVKERAMREVSSTELLKKNLKGMPKSSDLAPIVGMLEDGHIFKKVDPPKNPSGGRPQKRWAVNPKDFA